MNYGLAAPRKEFGPAAADRGLGLRCDGRRMACCPGAGARLRLWRGLMRQVENVGYGVYAAENEYAPISSSCVRCPPFVSTHRES